MGTKLSKNKLQTHLFPHNDAYIPRAILHGTHHQLGWTRPPNSFPEMLVVDPAQLHRQHGTAGHFHQTKKYDGSGPPYLERVPHDLGVRPGAEHVLKNADDVIVGGEFAQPRQLSERNGCPGQRWLVVDVGAQVVLRSGHSQ